MHIFFTTPLSADAAYCLGGIISADEIKDCKDGRFAMLLPIRHNPNQVSTKLLKLHKKHITTIIGSCNGTMINPVSSSFKNWFPKNKEGFLVAFYRDFYIDYSDILTFAIDNIKNAPTSIKRAFLAGAFDGRCSWDKTTRKIVLDCSDSRGTDLICSILDDFSIKYDYNLARNRKIGNTPRKPQLRILSNNVPDFMKTIGLISPAKIAIIAESSFGDVLSKNDPLLSGLTLLLGLRHNMRSVKISAPSTDEILHSRFADEQLQKGIVDTKIAKHKIKPKYAGIPKEKETVSPSSTQRDSYPRKQRTALNALEIADFKCEFDSAHRTFIRKRDSMPYTEPHHLIPLEYHDKFDVSLDVEENIVSLCSTCHNQLHYGRNIEIILEPLYNSRHDLLAKAGIVITYNELLKMYK